MQYKSSLIQFTTWVDFLVSALASQYFGVNLTISTSQRKVNYYDVHQFPKQFWMMKLAFKNVNMTRSPLRHDEKLEEDPVSDLVYAYS